MRESGSPRVAYVQAQRIHTPDDLGMNALGYAGALQPGTAVPVDGFGMWSIYISLTGGAGNTSLSIQIMEETSEGTVLCTLLVSAGLTVAAGTQHFTFGAPGTTVPLVAARMLRLAVQGPGAGFTATARLFGRAT